jgi:hypothetical protein
MIVHCRIDGRGPFNFLLDTGAPWLILTRSTATAVAILPDSDHQATVRKLELEGGCVVANASCLIDDVFQVVAMNKIGAMGCEVHGLVGYTILERFRVDIDLAREEMIWTAHPSTNGAAPPRPLPSTRLARGGSDDRPAVAPRGGSGPVDRKGTADRESVVFEEPAPPEPLGHFPVGLAGLEVFTRAVTWITPSVALPRPIVRGSLGLELDLGAGRLRVKKVLEGGAANRGGVKMGDTIVECNGPARSSGELLERFAGTPEGSTVKLTVERGRKTIRIELRAGGGF